MVGDRERREAADCLRGSRDLRGDTGLDVFGKLDSADLNRTVKRGRIGDRLCCLLLLSLADEILPSLFDSCRFFLCWSILDCSTGSGLTGIVLCKDLTYGCWSDVSTVVRSRIDEALLGGAPSFGCCSSK